MASPERNDNLISRRNFLIGGGLIVAFTVLGIKGFDKVQSRYLPSAPEAQDLEPQLALLGAIAVYEGANIRTSPKIPERTKFRKPDNTIDWKEIETINGIPFAGAKAFVIVNAPAVYGQGVSKNLYNKPFYKDATFHGYEYWWIKLSIKKNGQSQSTAGYLNYSHQTREFVIPLEYIEEADKSGPQIYYSGRQGSVHEKELGKIVISKNPQTVAQEIMPDLWAQEVKAKLDGTASLSPGERIVENVEVVAFGNTWDEPVSMKEAGTPVNVRDHPGTYYADAERPIFYLNGEPTRILGVVNQETRINRVLETRGFGAFKFADLEGPLLDQEGHQVNLLPDKICAIWSPYLASGIT